METDPCSALITTTKGLMDPASLRRVTGEVDNDDEHTTWVEYYDGDELVHRSAHVRLKKGVEIQTIAATIGG
jgi:hypothetical protein